MKQLGPHILISFVQIIFVYALLREFGSLVPEAVDIQTLPGTTLSPEQLRATWPKEREKPRAQCVSIRKCADVSIARLKTFQGSERVFCASLEQLGGFQTTKKVGIAGCTDYGQRFCSAW
jgi:hypothetical protein